MGKSKTSLFTPAQNRVAELAKAIGHPARVAILEFLVKNPGCFCGDIVEKLPLSQSTVSQHLKALKEVGIIKGNIEGVSICYCIDAKVWTKAQKQMQGLFQKINNCC